MSLLMVLVVLLSMFVFHHYEATARSFLPPCLFNSLTGLYCTGCGITRAFLALFNGQVGRAFSMNALAMTTLPIGLIVWLDDGVGGFKHGQRAIRLLKDARVWAFVVIVFTLARNIPIEPFLWLAPS